jgi:hypothetical protein
MSFDFHCVTETSYAALYADALQRLHVWIISVNKGGHQNSLSSVSRLPFEGDD